MGKKFLGKLDGEISRWLGLNLISPEQAEKIRALYGTDAISVDSKPDMMSRLPSLLIGIAVLLLGVGVILFYAANWREMSPQFKLIQIFTLITSCYGVAAYFLFINKDHPLLGRAFLLLGMISFGAGIGLVAQVFHISAHPTNGLLLWLGGVLLISIIMEERWGYYLTALLGFIWFTWELYVYLNPSYVFVLLPLLLLYLFHRKEDPVGLIISLSLLVVWFYLSSFEYLEAQKDPAAGFAFVILHLPVGLLLIALTRLKFLEEKPFLKVPLAVQSVVGWLYVFAPFILLSWPINFKFDWYIALESARPFTTASVLILGLVGLLIYYLREKQADHLSLALGFVAGVLLLALPMGHKTTLMVATHLGLLGFILSTLYFSYGGRTRRPAERFLALALASVALFAKGIGLLTLGLETEAFRVAYCLGFVIFATVVFLINQFVRDLFKNAPPENRFSPGLLNAFCTVTIYLMMYAVAFRVSNQKSILNADLVVLLIIILFVALGLLLYGILWVRKAERLPLLLSGLIFFISGVIIFAAGPGISWQVYSLIFNGLMFISIGVLIYYSTRINSILLANLSVAALVLTIMTRYFDLFWDLLSGSALFMVTGVIVFVGGFFLERNRRKLIKLIEEGEEQHG